MHGDSTFPIINNNEHPSVPAPTRRPLPNLISAFIPSASSMLPAPPRMTSPPSHGAPFPAKPPAMKRPRGGNGIRRPVETPQNGMAVSRELRAIKSIEPNGEEAPRRSSRLKSTPTLPVSKVSFPVLCFSNYTGAGRETGDAIAIRDIISFRSDRRHASIQFTGYTTSIGS